MWQAYRESVVQVSQLDNASARLLELKAKLQHSELRNDTLRSKQELQADLFDMLHRIASKHDVSIVSISNPVVQTTEHYLMTGFEVQLAGGFHGIVKATDEIEDNAMAMQLVAMSYKRSHDRILKKDQLKAKLYIQHYKSNKP